MTRALAATVIASVIQEQKSLSLILKQTPAPKEARDNSLVRELCYGTLRWHPQLEALLASLLKKPLKKKDIDIQALLLIGLYQLIHTRIPDHAAIAETVNASRSLKKNWAAGMVNGVLRNFQRNQADISVELHAGDLTEIGLPISGNASIAYIVITNHDYLSVGWGAQFALNPTRFIIRYDSHPILFESGWAV